MRALVWLCVAMAEFSAVPGSRQTVVIPSFADHIKVYLDLEKKLEGSLPGIKSTNNAAEIEQHQRELTAKIVEARRDARQGEVFTTEIAARFRAIIRMTFQEPGSQIVRRTVQEGDPARTFSVKVNSVYPVDSPVQTTPPTLLNRLPELPMQLSFRIVGRNFVLLDNKTNLIVDFIPDAIP